MKHLVLGLTAAGLALHFGFPPQETAWTWLLTRFLVIRDQPENVPWFSINVEADRELAGRKINDKVRVPIHWEDMEKEVINVRGSHKTAVSKIATKLFKACLSLFFLSPPGLLFLQGQMEFARKCQVLLCFSRRLFCFFHRRGCVFNDNSKPKTV